MKYSDKEIRKLLKKEFSDLEKTKGKPKHQLDAIVVLSAQETGINGENGQRIKIGLKLFEKKKRIKFIFLGTKTHNRNLEKYLNCSKFNFNIVYPTNRRDASTRTQIKDLAAYLHKTNLKDIVIISHTYHIPRVKRYCSKFLNPKIKVTFWTIGKIEDQRSQAGEEVDKIINYSRKGDLPLFL